MIVTILGNADGIILGIHVGTELRALDESFDGYNDGKLERLFIGDSLGSTDDKVIGFYEGIKLWLSNVKMIGAILEGVNGIIVGLDVGKKLCSLVGSFYGSNVGNLEVLLIWGSLWYFDGKVLVSDEGFKQGLSDGKVIVTILWNVDVIIVGLYVGRDLGSLYGSFWRFLWWQDEGIVGWRLTGI